MIESGGGWLDSRRRTHVSGVRPLMIAIGTLPFLLAACGGFTNLSPTAPTPTASSSIPSPARAMLIQLYRGGAGLLHEEIAPRDGAPSITFRRVNLPAIEYELRVVSMEPGLAHPFTLTLTTWQ
jgi:hypothetical protein